MREQALGFGSILALVNICNQMLAYSGKGHFVIEAVDLSHTISNFTSIIDASIGKHVSIDYALSTGLSQINADVTQLQQIIMNLLINASGAVADSGGKITPTTGEIHAVKVMIVSGYNEEDAMPHFKDFDIVGFIRKPFVMANFLDDVKHALSSSVN